MSVYLDQPAVLIEITHFLPGSLKTSPADASLKDLISQTPMKNKIKVKLKSSFAIGPTADFLSRFATGQYTVLEVDSGTTIERFLSQLSSLGSPDEWDDVFLHVFVNGEVKGMNYVLLPDDVVDIHIPVSGG